MRKIFISEMVTVDGYFAGISEEINWHNVDAEFNSYAAGMLNEVDTLIFGRTTYDIMAAYWPTEKPSDPNDAIVAEKMNSLEKIVFSKSMSGSDWNGTKVLSEINAEEIKRWKDQPGKDMVILGSGTIVQQFANLGLIDEYRLMVNPVILGKGKTLFQDVNRLDLKLLSAQAFKSGNVLLRYKAKS